LVVDIALAIEESNEPSVMEKVLELTGDIDSGRPTPVPILKKMNSIIEKVQTDRRLA
jgi:hypothetical protein